MDIIDILITFFNIALLSAGFVITTTIVSQIAIIAIITLREKIYIQRKKMLKVKKSLKNKRKKSGEHL